ncbi:MAG: glycosyltransferase family protein, partial [Actinomycetota bacterium]
DACRWLAGGLANALAVRAAVIREAKTRVLRQSAAVLNKFEPSEMAGVNARLFEARGSGGAVACEPRRALTGLLGAGAEVLALRTYLELVAAPLEARAGGDVADQRAHANRTYERPIRAILEDVA